MRAAYTSEYTRFRERVLSEDKANRTGGTALLLAMEKAILALPHEPVEESVTFKRVQQARKHRLWRVSHPYRPNIALRIILWFPDPSSVVIALLGHNKAQTGDAWYGYAATQGQAIVDQYLRTQGHTP